MEYISSDLLILEVKDKLSSWFDSNKVDDSIFFPVLRECLSQFKQEAHPQKFAMIEIENKVGKLPLNFDKLKMAVACMPQYGTHNSLERFEETINTEERHVCSLNLCESSCDVCHDYNGNMYQVVQTFRRTPITVKWNVFDVLNIARDTRKAYCSGDCINFGSKSPNGIEIKNGNMHTTFDSGLVYIEYDATFEDGTSYLIPKHPKVEEWIKAEMIKEVFQTLYWNGEPDILQRYNDTKVDLHVKKENARIIIKRTELDGYYKLSNKLINRYNKVKSNIWLNSLYSTSPELIAEIHS